MLPLVQMHQMVQSPPHLDHLAPFQSHLKADGGKPVQYQPRSSARPSHPYSPSHPTNTPIFALRTSQPFVPTLHRITTTFVHARTPDQSEHSLRRKTPNGTIDNGYDGSLAHLASGPPALKHLVVPANRKIYPTAVVRRPSIHSAALPSPPTPGARWQYEASTAANSHGQAVDGLSSPPSTLGGWGFGQPQTDHASSPADRSSLLQPAPQHPYHLAAPMQYVVQPGYPPTASPTIFNPATFQQMPNWMGGGAMAGDYRSPVPLTPGLMQPSAVVDSAYMPTQSTIQPGLANGPPLGIAQPFKSHLSSHPLDDGFSRYGQQQNLINAPYRRLEALSLGPGSPGLSDGGSSSGSPNARFKERALAQAHKTYADLLLYLNHVKKVQNAKAAPGSRPPSKMVVFPKPPKQLSPTTNRGRPVSAHFVADPVSIYSQQHIPKPPNPVRAYTYSGRPTDFQSIKSANGLDQLAGSRAPVLAEVIGNPGSQITQFANSPLRALSQEIVSPVANARSSLEILSNLCEYSEWQWVDGILLGGCLHYGLENYLEALEWFKRIIKLDENHVEAISNIAATLYCMNRQEEAEENWVQAVRLRPGYLEAVEHLVGLLCSNHRSQEAVQIINFVQEKLRLPASLSPRTRHIDAAQTSDKSSTKSATDQEIDASFLGMRQSGSETLSPTVDVGKQRGFGSSGYAIPGNDNGRMLLLLHAKGNMLYGLKEVEKASEAFEEAVLISAGRKVRGVQSLIRMIHRVLAPRDFQGEAPRSPMLIPTSRPLLLPPERAKFTSQLVFSSSSGQLPGLRYIPDGSHKKAAISTTSNSLLSLAKIFQDAMSNGGSSPGLMQQPTVGDILALYYLSLSLQESPSTANNVGILLASVQQSASPQATTPEVTTSQTIPGIIPGSGLALALAYYRYGLSLDPKHVHLHTNLGSLLKDIGQLDSAIQMYEKAVQCDGNFDIALTNLANAVKDRGRINDAIIYYKRAVHSNPDFAEAVCGLSTALNSVCDWRDRGGVVLYGGKYDRWHVDTTGMLSDVRTHKQASGLMKRVVEIVGRQLDDASTWGCGTLREHTILQLLAQLNNASNTSDDSFDLTFELQRWAGRPWEGSRVLRLIERSTRATMRSWYHDKYTKGAHSSKGYTRPRLPTSLTVPTAPTVLPFHTFTCPLTAKDIRMISQRNALRISCSTLRSPWLPATVYEPPAPPSPQLNIGYVSSDFNNHPLAHLMQSVFGFHDQSRAKAFCYATTASDKSIHRKQIEQEAPVFRDVSNWTSDKLVEQIVKDGIHILVNLNGYTRGARNEIFAARPAPIQMSFMGFAGTLGAEWCDYLLADTTAIPPSMLRPHRNNLTVADVFRDEADNNADDWIYSENIIFCRETFFCCDHAQSGDGSGERNMTWEEEQRRRWKMRKELFPTLPDDKIILGNFNQLYKIDPTTFRTWLRILDAVPNAMLWLLRFPELGESNLKRTAKAWAGEEVASRIMFTDVAPKQQHISRARVCDLFLDTPECNAHTTAADVLWSSTPLLTLPRYEYKMCSRMAASILKGALPKGPDGARAAKDLVVADELEYEARAVSLASDLTYDAATGHGTGRLADLRKLLWQSKWTCALFDTRRWVRDLEDAYEEAWRRWVAGEGGDIYL